MRPIIETGAANSFLGEVESEGAYEMEWGVGRCAGAGD
jgi:hypothetical protein